MNHANSTFQIERFNPIKHDLAEVVALWRANSATLGFLPNGAFEEKVDDGCILVALQESRIIGYLLYNLTRTDVVIVHLCLAKEFRGVGIAEQLVERLRQESPKDWPMRLTCRRDYKSATRLWARLGFHPITRKTGRGADKADLQIWQWEAGGERPLLAKMNSLRVEGQIKAVIDANVYFDLIDPDSATTESKCLAQEWLDGVVAFMRTPELNVEVNRQADPVRRGQALGRLGAYVEVPWKHADFERVHAELCRLLPAASREQDESDLRQVAYAIAAEIPYFITRDGGLLRYGEDIARRFHIEVMTPVDFVRSLDEDRNAGSYQPYRLGSTSLSVRRVNAADRDEIVQDFLRTPQGETKGAWARILNEALGDLTTCDVQALHAPGGKRIVICATRLRDHILEIPVLRAEGQKTALTAVRHVLMSAVVRAAVAGCRIVTCSDAGSPQLCEALADAGFRRRPDGVWARALVSEILTREQLLERLQADPELGDLASDLAPDASALDYERRLWPLKLTGESVPCFLVPIKPHWAHALFDHELKGQLFHAPVELACALENVFYTASRQRALQSARARVLWYVSQGKNEPKVQSVRACSMVDDGVFGSARELFSQHWRLGVYKWPQVLKAAHGVADKPFVALRFSHTELFKTPISKGALPSIFRAGNMKENRVQNPLRVSEEIFFDLYRRGTGRGSAA